LSNHSEDWESRLVEGKEKAIFSTQGRGEKKNALRTEWLPKEDQRTRGRGRTSAGREGDSFTFDGETAGASPLGEKGGEYPSSAHTQLVHPRKREKKGKVIHFHYLAPGRKKKGNP